MSQSVLDDNEKPEITGRPFHPHQCPFTILNAGFGLSTFGHAHERLTYRPVSQTASNSVIV